MDMHKIAVLTMALTIMPIYNAYADSLTSNPGTIPLNGNTDITLSVDIQRTVTYVAVYDPTATLVTSSSIDPSIPLPTINAGESYTWNLNNDLGVYPNMIGNWLVVIDTEEGTQFIIDFATSFFVLPESPIGAVAIIGSSIAMLGVFAYKKSR